jgi:hypothetical protein
MSFRAEPTEGVWKIRHRVPLQKSRTKKLGTVEDLQYHNPYRYKIERVWFDGRIVLATEAGEVHVDPKKVKVAQYVEIRQSRVFETLLTDRCSKACGRRLTHEGEAASPARARVEPRPSAGRA